MSTVSSLSSPFNLAQVANDLLAGPGVTRRAIGHADECLAQLTDPDSSIQVEPDELSSQEILDGLVEWDADRSVQAADDHVAAELRDAIRLAKERFGASVDIRFSRELTVNSQTGTSVAYNAVIIPKRGGAANVLVDSGVSPIAALDKVTARIDQLFHEEKGGYGTNWIGYKIPDLALILIGEQFERTAAEARDLARRIALDEAYLNTQIEFHVPGVVELRDEEPAPATAAVAAAAA